MAATENLLKYWTLLSRKFCATAQFAHLGSQPNSWMEGKETSKKTVSYRSVKKQRCHWQTHAPSNSYIEALIPSVTIFGDRILKVIIKAKWSYNHGARICRTGVLTRKRRDPRPQINLPLSLHVCRRKAMWRHEKSGTEPHQKATLWHLGLQFLTSRTMIKSLAVI